MQENTILKTAQFGLALNSGCSDEEHQCDVTIEQVHIQRSTKILILGYVSTLAEGKCEALVIINRCFGAMVINY